MRNGRQTTQPYSWKLDSEDMTLVLKLGLVGTGRWASAWANRIPSLSDEVVIAGVWSRNLRTRSQLASNLGCEIFDSYEELLDRCDAVAFSVPPAAQERLAIKAAERRLPLLLDKPLGASLEGAEKIAAAVRENSAPSMMMLTFRFDAQLLRFIESSEDRSGAIIRMMPSKDPADGWRDALGPWLEAGPHALSILEVVGGEILNLRALRTQGGHYGAVAVHTSGMLSTVQVSYRSPRGTQLRDELILLSESGPRRVALYLNDFDAVVREALGQFLRTCRGEEHSMTAEYGLHLQRLLHQGEDMEVGGKP